MATPRRYRWVCPECASGKLAGKRPRARAARFCLPCSEAKGKLVERTCPVLERVKAEKQARALRSRTGRLERLRTRAMALAAARREKVMFPHAEFQRLWVIGCKLTARPDISPKRLPHFKLRRSATRTGCTGHAYGINLWAPKRIVVTAGRCDVATVYGAIAHEVAHHLAPPPTIHGEPFWSMLCELVREAYGITPDISRQRRINDRQAVIDQVIRDVFGTQAVSCPGTEDPK